MDDTDFDLLCKGLSADEAKRMRKILNEWCDGDENGFPVQLALLTRAQWRATAMLPNIINDSGKAIERYLAECRQHCAAIVKNLSTVTEDSTAELKSLVKMHTETVSKVSASFHNELWQTEQVAKQIRDSLGSGISEWRKARDDFAAERQKLEKERKELAARIQWRDWFWAGLLMLGMIAIGIVIGVCLAGKFHQMSQEPNAHSLRALLGGKFASACDNLTQINPDGPGNPQQRVQREISQVPFDEAHDGMRETAFFTFFPQQSNDVGGNDIAQVVFDTL